MPELNLTALDDAALGQRVTPQFNAKNGDKIPMRDNCQVCGDTRYALVVEDTVNGVSTGCSKIGYPAFHTHDPNQRHGTEACVSYLAHRHNPLQKAADFIHGRSVIDESDLDPQRFFKFFDKESSIDRDNIFPYSVLSRKLSDVYPSNVTPTFKAGHVARIEKCPQCGMGRWCKIVMRDDELYFSDSAFHPHERPCPARATGVSGIDPIAGCDPASPEYARAEDLQQYKGRSERVPGVEVAPTHSVPIQGGDGTKRFPLKEFAAQYHLRMDSSWMVSMFHLIRRLRESTAKIALAAAEEMRRRFEEEYEKDSGYKPCWRPYVEGGTEGRYLHKDQADAWIGWQLAHRQVDFGLLDPDELARPFIFHMNGLVSAALRQTNDPDREETHGRRSFAEMHRTLTIGSPRGMGATEWALQLGKEFKMPVILGINPGLTNTLRRMMDDQQIPEEDRPMLLLYRKDWEKQLLGQRFNGPVLLVLDRHNYNSREQREVRNEIRGCWGRSITGELMVVIS